MQTNLSSSGPGSRNASSSQGASHPFNSSKNQTQQALVASSAYHQAILPPSGQQKKDGRSRNSNNATANSSSQNLLPKWQSLNTVHGAVGSHTVAQSQLGHVHHSNIAASAADISGGASSHSYGLMQQQTKKRKSTNI